MTFGIKGIDTGKDWYWAKGDAILVQDVGGAVLTAGQYIEVEYYGLFEVMVHGTDEDAVAAQLAIEGAGTGLVEDVSDDPNITDLDTAIESITAMLKYYIVHGRAFTFTTRTSGLRPGQLATITHSRYGLVAAEMLIESVRTYRTGVAFWYEVKAILGPAMGSWSKFFNELSLIGQVYPTDVSIGSNATLIILKQMANYWEWLNELTVTPYTCPICGDTTLCGDTTIVC